MRQKNFKRIGVLALQGDVREHVLATQAALKKLRYNGEIATLLDQTTIQNLDALIIPGGESTVLERLTTRAGIFEEIKKIKNIFGTCAGTIFLAKEILHPAAGQKTLKLMDITADRNAYGSQTASFEIDLKTELGNVHTLFIRAPRITKAAPSVKILAKIEGEIVAAEEERNGNYYLATCFHPELTTTIFHEYFLKHVYQN